MWYILLTVKVLFVPRCACLAAHTGHHCETRLDLCEHNACMNGSQCLTLDTGYTCICQPGMAIWKIIKVFTVADPGFPRKGTANLEVGTPMYHLAKIMPKTDEIERKSGPGAYKILTVWYPYLRSYRPLSGKSCIRPQALWRSEILFYFLEILAIWLVNSKVSKYSDSPPNLELISSSRLTS